MSQPSRDHPSRDVTLRQRLQYRFDNLLSLGTWPTLLWLGAATLLAVLFAAVVLSFFQVTFTGDEDASFLEDFWQSLLRVMDPGTMAGDIGWGRRILALGITVFGLLVAGTLIGVIANGVEQRVDAMKRGRSTVVESGHIVVLGHSERLPRLVHHLALTQSRSRRGRIVVLADREPSELNEEVRKVGGGRPATKLVVRSGDPVVPADLAMTRLHEARAVVVLSDGSGSDARAIKTVMAVGAELGDFEDVPVVVELNDPQVGEGLVKAWGPGIHPIVPIQAITRIASYALRSRGLGQVVTRLTDLVGSDLQVISVPEPDGRSFGEIVLRYANARPIGRMVPSGVVELNPAPDVTVESDDRLVVVANGRGPFELSGHSRGRTSLEVDVPGAMETRPTQDHVLVVGWNRLGAAMLQDWAVFAAPGSSVEIVYDSTLVEPEQVSAPPGTEAVQVSLTPTSQLSALASTVRPEVTTVLLLGYEDQLSTEDADSRTLLELAALRRQERVPGESPRVITQLLDADNIPLSGALGADDFVVSDAIGSQLIAQLVEQPERRPILLEFYRPGGTEIRLLAAGKLGLAGDRKAGDVFEALYGHGLICIGWRLRRSVENLILNPHESTSIDFAHDDEIVVIV